MKIERAYESNRNVLDWVKNTIVEDDPDTLVSKYDYTTDNVGRRTFVSNEGAGFDCLDDHHWDFGYNDRNELTGGNRRDGTTANAGDAIMPGDYDYSYDPIGNRMNSNLEGQQNALAYTSNSVNQYSATTYPTESFGYDSDGNLATDGMYTYAWDGENRLIAVQTQLDLGANATEPDGGDKRLEFTYDYMGRRVEKKYSIRVGSSWSEQTHQRFVYDGWNVVLVLDGNSSNNVKQKYTWGLDLSGQTSSGQRAAGFSPAGIHDAGGIGGLLAAVETSGTHAGAYWFTYDGNGNVGQVLKVPTSGAIAVAAKYEYDPYGNTLSALGDYAAANPFRFSTKWLDSELANWTTNGAVGNTGLYYYGYRYYSPRLGRWISRDPIGEAGTVLVRKFSDMDVQGDEEHITNDMNVYLHTVNNPIGHIDPRGTDIFLVEGHESFLLNLFHQKVCGGCGKSPDTRICFSYGYSGRNWSNVPQLHFVLAWMGYGLDSLLRWLKYGDDIQR